jgi:hypothetical protein
MLISWLLPFFHAHRPPQISVAEVDRYREFKVREQVLSSQPRRATAATRTTPASA